MSGRAWTPGDWKASPTGQEGSRTYLVEAVQAGNLSRIGRTLATVSAPLFPTLPGETEAEYAARWDALAAANARLIAAAPELFEALARVIARYDANNFLRTAAVHKSDCGCMRCAVDAARAALAKATEGGSHG